jgi:HAMP domain-containing protein
MEAVSRSQRTFMNLINNDTRVLSSTLMALLNNTEIAAAFKTGDREKLYARTAPLFQNLKTKHGITHWYFIHSEDAALDKARRCFLRVHDTTITGDEIKRFTYLKAVEEKEVSSGIELGKTAFALRVVSPYYSNGKLIGYMELGEEIDHVFNQMKTQSKTEYGLLVRKQYLNRDDWKSVRIAKGLDDSWDNMSTSVLISSTTSDEHLIDFTGSLTDVPDGGKLLEQVSKGNNHYVRGIFPLYDAGNRKVGGIFVLCNITPQYERIQKTRVYTVALSIIITLLVTIIILAMVQRMVIRRLRIMTDKATRVAGGDFHAKIEKFQDDEIGEFETLFEQFRVIFVTLLEKAEEKSQQG